MQNRDIFNTKLEKKASRAFCKKRSSVVSIPVGTKKIPFCGTKECRREYELRKKMKRPWQDVLAECIRNKERQDRVKGSNGGKDLTEQKFSLQGRDGARPHPLSVEEENLLLNQIAAVIEKLDDEHVFQVAPAPSSTSDLTQSSKVSISSNQDSLMTKNNDARLGNEELVTTSTRDVEPPISAEKDSSENVPNFSTRCMICGKLLTDSESIKRKIGPTCWNKIGNKDDLEFISIVLELEEEVLASLCQQLIVSRKLTVMEIAEWLQISKRKINNILKTKLREIYYHLYVEEQLPVSEISAMLGINRSTFYRKLKKLNIPYREKTDDNFSSELKEQAESCFMDGDSVPVIAQKLQVNSRKIISLIRTLIIEKVTDLYMNSSKSVVEIIEEVGITKEFAYQILEQHSVSRRSSWTDEEAIVDNADQILLLLQEGITLDEIAKRLNVSRVKLARFVKEHSKKVLLQLYIIQQRPISEICQILGIDKSVLYRWLKEREIKTKRQEVREETEELLDELTLAYLRLDDFNAIRQRMHLSNARISVLLKKAGFELLSPQYMKKCRAHCQMTYWKELTPHLEEIITGELLGDGYLEPNVEASNHHPVEAFSLSDYKQSLDVLQKLASMEQLPEDKERAINEFNKALNVIKRARTASFGIGVSAVSEPLLQCLSEHFQQNGYHVRMRQKKKKPVIYLNTDGSVQLHALYTKWYPQGKKVVPRDITFTPTVLLHWYLGDGNIDRQRITLHTEGFSKEEVEFLVQRLKEDVGLEQPKVHEYHQRRAGKVYYQIRIYRKKDVDHFLEWIQKADPLSLKAGQESMPWKFSRELTKTAFLQKKTAGKMRLSVEEKVKNDRF